MPVSEGPTRLQGVASRIQYGTEPFDSFTIRACRPSDSRGWSGSSTWIPIHSPRGRPSVPGASLTPVVTLEPITDANREAVEALLRRAGSGAVRQRRPRVDARGGGGAGRAGDLLGDRRRRAAGGVRDDRRRGRRSGLHPPLPVEAAHRRGLPAARVRDGDARPDRVVLPGAEGSPRCSRAPGRARAAPSRSTSGYGFRPTGEVHDGEIFLRLAID